MYPIVHERFSERSEQISELLQNDLNFDEMCSDYEELACWLSAFSQGDATPDAAYVENRRLLTELEAEILQSLLSVERQPRN